MTIERFTKEEFEAALTSTAPFYEEEGLVQGEHTYIIPVNSQTRLRVRSSVGANGVAADTGDDSIRIWVQFYQPDWKNPSRMTWTGGKKFDAYTTRIPGWAKRMDKKIHELWNIAAKLTSPIPTSCPHCGRVPRVGFSSKKNKNFGRPYCSCGNPAHKAQKVDFFQWLDGGNGKGTVITFEEAKAEPEKLEPAADEITLDDIVPVEEQPEPERTNVSKPEEAELEVDLSGLKAALKAKPKAAKKPKPISKAKKGTANVSQQVFIEADPNANIRLMAPPGSGKTFSIERRVKYLIDTGIAPKDILVVTFSKKMSDEMRERILKTCPTAKRDQISTIHAFCYRVLCKWYENSPYHQWDVAKDWQERKFIEEGIEKYWVKLEEEELPSWKEVSHWTNISKFVGLTAEEAKGFFVKNLGARFGEYVYQIRKHVDGTMSRMKMVSFSDMIFLMEQQLQEPQFRSGMQGRFKHIIVDEGQDTSYQALRVLMTVGADPGTNPIYQNGIPS